MESVLFYTGYQLQHWSPKLLFEKGLGGSEIALYNVAKRIASRGYEVVVAGHVQEGSWDGLTFVDHSTLHRDFKTKKWKSVIATNYIHYLMELEDFYFETSYFWLHNTTYHTVWRNGKELEYGGRDLLQSTRITKVVCVSPWHRLQFLRDHPEWNEEGVIQIGNGIDLSLFQNRFEKVKHRFIYTSAANRGLVTLLEMWPEILNALPDATLVVCSPLYALPAMKQVEASFNLSSVKFIGALPPPKLYEQISVSDYWLYPTLYEETYCITALEMQAGGVSVITSDMAALKNTVADRGVLVNPKSRSFKQDYLSALLELELDNQYKSELIDKGKNWSKNQAWDNKVEEWIKLIEA